MIWTLCSLTKELAILKTIGLIGGMSWESSVEYYRFINEEVKKRMGGLHSAKCILYSVDFAEIEKYQATGDWAQAGEVLAAAASALQKAGADLIVICTNTMHKVVDFIERNVTIPVLHIADATAAAIKKADVHKVGLLGTKYTMNEPFYKERIEAHTIQVLVPNSEQIETINSIIYEELCLGVIKPASKEAFQRIIESLVDAGAEGVILGCTEIGLLIQQGDCDVPLFDTTAIHAIEAVKRALD